MKQSDNVEKLVTRAEQQANREVMLRKQLEWFIANPSADNLDIMLALVNGHYKEMVRPIL